MYEICGVVYPTQKSVIDRSKQIRYGHPHGYRLTGEEKSFVLYFLQLHPRAPVKIGTGVRDALVNCLPNGDRNFILIRNDGSTTNFSINKCLRPINKIKEVKEAARFAVKPQTKAFKDTHFTGKCEKTYVTISSKEAHVDHVPPLTFDVLLADFLNSINVSIEDIEVVNVGDMQEGKLFVDKTIGERWAKYHHEHAQLRIISVKENLGAKKVPGDYGL
jgi:hypothetical protein